MDPGRSDSKTGGPEFESRSANIYASPSFITTGVYGSMITVNVS
jgi:hypothetical protein